MLLLLLSFVLAGAYDVALESLIVALSAKKSQPKPIYVFGKDEKFPDDIKGDDTQHLAVSVKVVHSQNKKERIQPEQRVLLLKIKDNQKYPVGMPRIQQFELTPREDSSAGVEVILSFGHKNFKAVNGKYEMSILIADGKMEKPWIHPVGDITLNFSEPITALKSEKDYLPDEPIYHKFREPEKRPPYVVSLIFLVLSWAVPLAVFLAGVQSLKFNASYFPTGKKARFFSIAFMITLLLCALILAGFFFFLNIIQVGSLLLPLLFVAIIVGHQSLCASKDARTMGDAKEVKKQ